MSFQGSWRLVHSEASLGWGGQEHRVLAELVGLKNRGAWVSLLAPMDSIIFDRAHKAGIETRHLDTRKMFYPISMLRIKYWLREHEVQIVNTHSSRDGYLVGLAARLARVPLLIRSRHIDVSYAQPWISRHAFTTFADHVLTTSEKIASNLKSTFGLLDNHISMVPTGVDVERFSPKGCKAELFERKDRDGWPVIGMVSVLRSWKGHFDFLEIARQLRKRGLKACYVIVGEGPQRENILRKIDALDLAEDVWLAGHQENIPDVLRTLDVLVMPSTGHEGIPQVGLQALACGTPVVGSDAGGIPEIIRPGETGRICPVGKIALFDEAIEKALNEMDETRRMSEEGLRFVQQTHSVNHMLDRLEQIYSHHLPSLRNGNEIRRK